MGRKPNPLSFFARRTLSILAQTGFRFARKPFKLRPHALGQSGHRHVITLRSVLFNLLFYLNLVILLIAAIPTLVLPRQAYQPKNGIHINSRLVMKVGSGNSTISANVSHTD